MEGAMPNTDLESLVLNYRRRTAADHALLPYLVVARAKALRTEFLRELWRQFVSWGRSRAAIAQLRALDDAALKDIGLHRSGIEAAVVNAPPAAPRPPRRAFPEKPHLCLQRTSAAI
jgi:uncharacterized protein YjiS (DUF1127 family)